MCSAEKDDMNFKWFKKMERNDIFPEEITSLNILFGNLAEELHVFPSIQTQKLTSIQNLYLLLFLGLIFISTKSFLTYLCFSIYILTFSLFRLKTFFWCPYSVFFNFIFTDWKWVRSIRLWRSTSRQGNILSERNDSFHS